MASSSRIGPAIVVAVLACAGGAAAQPAAQGFAFERFYSSGAGGGWLVMNDLDTQDRLGGALALTLDYEHNPVHVGALDVISDKATADIAGAISYGRWRFYLDVDTVFVATGESGTANGYAFTAPSVSPTSHPDAIEDARLGIDVRLVGEPGDALRIGAGAQLYSPNDSRADYLTDGTFRGTVRGLVAGDLGRFAYAGQLGVQIRPLDDSPIPGWPDGSELLFGIAGGARIPMACGTWMAVVGPEIYGATAFRSVFSSDATAVEGLVSGRIEQTTGDGRRVRLKLGIGGGISHDFGAAEWRVVAGIEIFGQARHVNRSQ